MHYNEGSQLPREDVLLLLDRTDTLLDRADKAIRSLTKCVKSVRVNLEDERLELSESEEQEGSGLVYSRAVPIIETVFSCLRNNTMELYKASQTAPETEDILNGSRALKDTKSSAFSHENNVIVRLEDRAIFVHMPMLWSQNGRRIRGSNNRKIGPDRVTFFREDIASGVKNSPEFSTYNFDRYANKIVHFLYVYSDLPSNKLFITDNDNHETKYVQDAITMFLPGGDSPFSCSTFSSAKLSTAVPEGTYLTVTPMTTGILADHEIIDFWSRTLGDFGD